MTLKYRIAMLFESKTYRSKLFNDIEICQKLLEPTRTKIIKSAWIEVVR